MRIRVDGWAAQRAARFAAAKTTEEMRAALQKDGTPAVDRMNEDMVRQSVLTTLQYFVENHLATEEDPGA